MKLNPNLKEFWQTKADIKKLKGGRASSKTHDAGGFALFLAMNYRVRFLCIRQFQNKIEQSVYALLVDKIVEDGLEDEFEILKTTIRHITTGSEFFFYGMNRNTKEIKGFEGANVCWIEEAEGLTKEQWDIVNPTIRAEGAEVWLLYNPRLEDDFIETYEGFQHDPDNGVIVRHINYDENPFLSGTMVRKVERLKVSNYDDYEHIYLGVPRSDNNSSIIKRSWIEAAVNAHEKLHITPGGKHFIGFDIADSGDDKSAYIVRHGFLAAECEEWKSSEDELNKSARKTYAKAKETKAHINYDSIGVGASAGSTFKDLNEEYSESISYAPFNAADKVQRPDDEYEHGVTNRDHFSNLKAQMWWSVAQRFKKTYDAVINGDPISEDDLISISLDLPYIDQLKRELSTPQKDFDKAGRVKVESKSDLKKRGVESPNIADAFIMAYYQPVITQQFFIGSA